MGKFWQFSDYLWYAFLAFTLPTALIAMFSLCTIAYFKYKKKQSRRVERGLWCTAMVVGGLSFASTGSFEFIPIGASVALFLIWHSIIAFSMYKSMYSITTKQPVQPMEEELHDGDGNGSFQVVHHVTRTAFSWRGELLPALVQRGRTPVMAWLLSGVVVGTLLGITCGFCYALHPTQISTLATRKTLVCSPSTVCHLYFTAGPDHNSMFAVAHFTLARDDVGTDYSDSNVNVKVNKVPVSQDRITLIRRVDYDEDRRLVIHAFLDVTAFATQKVTVSVSVKSSPEKEESFTPIPPLDTFNTKVTFLVGGDIETDDPGWSVTKQGVEKSVTPSFAVIGGDLAYENSIRACFDRLDVMLSNLVQHLRTKEGGLLPMITAIGNHDAGGFEIYYRPAFYLDYFPAKLTDPDKKAYHTHIFGSLGVLILDSGVLSSVDSQNDLLKATLLDWGKKNIAPIVTYHVPAYPSQRELDSSPTKEVRANWIPIFDYCNLTVAFENHDHLYKRTKPMRNDAPVEQGKGTVYIGDGSWGVGGGRVAEDRPYLEKYGAFNFVLGVDVDLNTKKISVKAIREDGFVADSWNATILY